MFIELLDAYSHLPDEVDRVGCGVQSTIIFPGAPEVTPKIDAMLLNWSIGVIVNKVYSTTLRYVTPSQLLNWGTLESAEGFGVFRDHLKSIHRSNISPNDVRDCVTSGDVHCRVNSILRSDRVPRPQDAQIEDLTIAHIETALQMGFVHTFRARTGDVATPETPVTILRLGEVMFYEPAWRIEVKKMQDIEPDLFDLKRIRSKFAMDFHANRKAKELQDFMADVAARVTRDIESQFFPLMPGLIGSG